MSIFYNIQKRTLNLKFHIKNHILLTITPNTSYPNQAPIQSSSVKPKSSNRQIEAQQFSNLTTISPTIYLTSITTYTHTYSKYEPYSKRILTIRRISDNHRVIMV